MTAKTFVVTGATSGIGLGLARALAHSAERLVIVGRNEARLRAAIEATGREERDLEIIPILADLGRLEGTRSLAEQLDRLPRIDVLIHNAGILPAQRRLTRRLSLREWRGVHHRAIDRGRRRHVQDQLSSAPGHSRQPKRYRSAFGSRWPRP